MCEEVELVRFVVPITFFGDTIQYAALGESVLIKCQVQASPVAEVSWFKGQDKTRIGLLMSPRCSPSSVRFLSSIRWSTLFSCQ